MSQPDQPGPDDAPPPPAAPERPFLGSETSNPSPPSPNSPGIDTTSVSAGPAPTPNAETAARPSPQPQQQTPSPPATESAEVHKSAPPAPPSPAPKTEPTLSTNAPPSAATVPSEQIVVSGPSVPAPSPTQPTPDEKGTSQIAKATSDPREKPAVMSSEAVTQPLPEPVGNVLSPSAKSSSSSVVFVEAPTTIVEAPPLRPAVAPVSQNATSIPNSTAQTPVKDAEAKAETSNSSKQPSNEIVIVEKPQDKLAVDLPKPEVETVNVQKPQETALKNQPNLGTETMAEKPQGMQATVLPEPNTENVVVEKPREQLVAEPPKSTKVTADVKNTKQLDSEGLAITVSQGTPSPQEKTHTIETTAPSQTGIQNQGPVQPAIVENVLKGTQVDHDRENVKLKDTSAGTAPKNVSALEWDPTFELHNGRLHGTWCIRKMAGPKFLRPWSGRRPGEITKHPARPRKRDSIRAKLLSEKSLGFLIGRRTAIVVKPVVDEAAKTPRSGKSRLSSMLETLRRRLTMNKEDSAERDHGSKTFVNEADNAASCETHRYHEKGAAHLFDGLRLHLQKESRGCQRSNDRDIRAVEHHLNRCEYHRGKLQEADKLHVGSSKRQQERLVGAENHLREARRRLENRLNGACTQEPRHGSAHPQGATKKDAQVVAHSLGAAGQGKSRHDSKIEPESRISMRSRRVHHAKHRHEQLYARELAAARDRLHNSTYGVERGVNNTTPTGNQLRSDSTNESKPDKLQSPQFEDRSSELGREARHF